MDEPIGSSVTEICADLMADERPGWPWKVTERLFRFPHPHLFGPDNDGERWGRTGESKSVQDRIGVRTAV